MALEAGLDVICDKPLTNDLDTALDLVKRARARGLVFCLTHNYSGYPMVRRRAPPLRPVNSARSACSRYPMSRDRSAPVSRTTPTKCPAPEMASRSGQGGLKPCDGRYRHARTSAPDFVSGQCVEAVLADVGAALPGRQAHDTASVIFRLESRRAGVMFATKAATGAENAMTLEPMEKKAALPGNNPAPTNFASCATTARRVEKPRTATLYPHSQRAVRLPPGHPKRSLKGSPNVYADFADLVSLAAAASRPTACSPRA